MMKKRLRLTRSGLGEQVADAALQIPGDALGEDHSLVREGVTHVCI